MKHTNQLVTGAEILGEWNDATYEWDSAAAEAKVSGLQCQSTAVSNGRCVRAHTRAHTHTRARAHARTHARTHTHTHPFNGPLSGTTRLSWYQKGKTNLDFTGVRDSEWQWLQLGHMQICTSLQTDKHTSTSLLSFLQAGCTSCHPTNSVKALKAREADMWYSLFWTMSSNHSSKHTKQIPFSRSSYFGIRPIGESR